MTKKGRSRKGQGAHQDSAASSSQQQEQQPPGPSQQQQRPPSPSQQQQRPPGPPQQQQRPPGPPQQQQRPPSPPQQQQRPPGTPQQQQRPPGPPQQQQRPPGPWQGQQQQRPPGLPQQQQRPPSPSQQQQRPPGPPQQQQRPRGPWQGQQQQRPPGLPQQQQRPPSPSQQQQRPPGPPQQQQRPPGTPQQQQRPRGPWQGQQQRPPRPPQQQQRPPGPSQQQQQQHIEETQTLSQYPSVETAVSVRGTSGRSTLPGALQRLYMEQIPRRSSTVGGKLGRPIIVETNMFKINFSSMFQNNVVHYDVVINPDRPKFLMRPIFEEYRRMYFPKRYPAFDGRKNAYSANDLPFGDHSNEADVKVFDIERQQERIFKVYMKKVAVLDLSWLTNIQYGTVEFEREEKGLQALDIILRHGPAYHFTPVGRSLFQQPEPGRIVSLSNGLDLWVGVFQSAVVGWRTYLNIDVAHKGFPTPQSVINLMRELCQNPRSTQQCLNPDDIKYNSMKITKFLKGLKVQYEIPGQPNSKRTYRVNELVECPRKNKFALEDGTLCSVENYFLQNKKYRLQFPELPCLWVGSRTNQKKIHLPAELCTIVAGQVTQKKMDEVQTAKMIREAATDTRKRREKIMNGFASMKLNEQPTLMNEFHLSVQGEFEKVPARVLQAPTLQYHNNKRVNVFKGVWRADQFLNPCDLPENSWTILSLDKYVQDRSLYELHDKLQDGGRFVKMVIGKALTPFTTLSIQTRNINEVLQYFNDKKKQNLKLVVVIIPNLDNAYSLVKQISELKVTGGVVTQCLKSQTLRKLSDATITNILLKINSKLNGVNHIFAPTHRPRCLEVPCMLIGADVTHPSPDATDIPSIAAVAASHDPNAFKYNIELRLQSPREEMIQDLENIMRKQLIFFFQQTKHKPKKIIFYRDGVSEGQLPQVMHYELSAIKRAIAKLENTTEHKIPITFLVVQKRHHIRLFPTDSKNSDDRNFNVQAGTIVDTEITHPTHIDFYLVSHASIQGTARPTKYRCICNENQLSEDEIEQLTYYLCHMFARCTRSVSYPAPTYYAHLAAFRARAWIYNVPLNISNLQEEQLRKMTVQMGNSPMFFV